ncbi:MAG: hypothetical protein NZ902_01280 [Acidilobaceae archaeon]|nr:hypothetical protein [Acidilobaceae archaeon]MCX8165456.1 hypothetical protein [Acidilobaceae archaeon]
MEELGLLPEEEVRELEARAYLSPATHIDVLIRSEERLEAFLRLLSSPECLEARELVISACEERGAEFLKYAELPEVARIALEGECVELHVPADPPQRIKEALRKMGLGEAKAIAYREVYLGEGA